MTDDLDLDLDRRFDEVGRYVRSRASGAGPDALQAVLARADRIDRWQLLARGGVAVFVVMVLVAAVGVWRGVGPAGDDGAVELRSQPSDPGSRVTISPLVDLQDRLTNRSEVEVFTVRTTTPGYWRLTSLDTFAGDIWRSGGKYTAVDGTLPAPAFTPAPPGGPAPGYAPTTTASFTIKALDVLWLPAPFRAVAVAGNDVAVRYQADSSTLIVDTSQPDSDGLTYVVTAEPPTTSEDLLRQASTDPPPDSAGRYTQLPDGLDPTIADLARTATAGATTTYDKARLLQDWFLSNFAYDLTVPRGHGGPRIAEFLQRRRGYGEQFAATYATMARALGIPTRVAVGFTNGDTDPNDPTLFHVRGQHAHAWPEVYLGQFGWIPFEPTPGHGPVYGGGAPQGSGPR